jgi:hypothetical protein
MLPQCFPNPEQEGRAAARELLQTSEEIDNITEKWSSGSNRIPTFAGRGETRLAG